MKTGVLEPLALVSNIFKCYELGFAMRGAKRTGFDYIEISSIVGSCVHVAPEEMTSGKAEMVGQMLKDNGLKANAFSGHADLTDDRQLADFLTKMRFAAGIGAKIINTNSGPVKNRDVFFKNMPKIIALAEKLDLIVCLESHGDIIDTAKSAVEVMRAFNHPLVRLNYDTGNTYYYARGRIDIAEDLKYGLPYLAHLHLKDVHIEGNRVWYRPIGKGDIDFRAVFKTLAELGRPVPCGLEIPIFVEGTFDALSPDGAPLRPGEIDLAISDSLESIRGLQQA